MGYKLFRKLILLKPESNMKLIKNSSKGFLSLLFIIILFSSTLKSSFGQGIIPGQGDDKDWNFVVAPYIWFSALNGVTGVGRVEADIDASFSDIFSNLNIGFMMYGEARYKKFGLNYV